MYAHLDRSPLDSAALSKALVYEGSLWSSVQVVPVTGSTNADLIAAEAPEGSVLVAEHQDAGRGRLERHWISPPQAGLTFSIVLRPPVAPSKWGWLPLLVGVALCEAVRSLGEVGAWLKWPNDLLVGRRRDKAAGILAEVAGPAVVVGVGLNVSTRADELPAGATSLALAGAVTQDRDTVLRAVLRAVEVRYRSWCAAEGDAVGCGLLSAYVGFCDTLGRDVSVSVPGGQSIAGRAEAIDSSGRLLVRGDGVLHPLAAGDVRHVRSVG